MISDFYQKSNIKLQKQIYALLIIFLFIISIVLCYYLYDFLVPFVLAVLFACALNPLVEKLKSKGLNSVLSVTFVLVFFLFIILIIIYFLYKNLSNFISIKYDLYFNKIQEFYDLIILKLIHSHIIKGAPQIEISNQVFIFIKDYFIHILSSTTTFLSQFILFFTYLCFILPGINNFDIKTLRAFSRIKANNINNINKKIIYQLQTYLSAKTFVSLLTGLFVYFICIVFKLELAFLWGILAFLLNYIPRFGSVIASLPPILLALIQSNSLLTAAIFALSLFIIHGVIGFVIEPKLFAARLSLSPLVIIVSMFFWGWLWGLIGIILATPVMAVISIIFQNIPSLKAIGSYLQSSYPIKEDEEKLSLIYHIINADKLITISDINYLENELKGNIYNPKYFKKTWSKIIKNPLTMDEIFFDKHNRDKVDLYYLACVIVALNKSIPQEEKILLHQIQTIALLSPESIHQIHSLIFLEKKVNLDKLIGINPYLKERENNIELSYIYKLLGLKYLESFNIKKSQDYFVKALRIYFLLDDTEEIIECFEKLTFLKNYASRKILI